MGNRRRRKHSQPSKQGWDFDANDTNNRLLLKELTRRDIKLFCRFSKAGMERNVALKYTFQV